MLKKGYSIIRKPTGEIIKNKDVIRDVKTFTAEFSDGIANIEKASFKK
jgi:exonuclease VII large subunit